MWSKLCLPILIDRREDIAEERLRLSECCGELWADRLNISRFAENNSNFPLFLQHKFKKCFSIFRNVFRLKHKQWATKKYRRRVSRDVFIIALSTQTIFIHNITNNERHKNTNRSFYCSASLFFVSQARRRKFSSLISNDNDEELMATTISRGEKSVLTSWEKCIERTVESEVIFCLLKSFAPHHRK